MFEWFVVLKFDLTLAQTPVNGQCACMARNHGPDLLLILFNCSGVDELGFTKYANGTANRQAKKVRDHSKELLGISMFRFDNGARANPRDPN